MSCRLRAFACLVGALAVVGPVAAVAAEGQRHQEEARAYFLENVASWVNDATVVSAVRAQNRLTRHLSDDEIESRDLAWRDEITSQGNDRPTVDAMLSGALSTYLKDRQRKSGWMVVEVIVMDGRGLNVGISAPTSDLWQGDEAKHLHTYQTRSASLLIDAVEYDASTGLLIAQVSKAIFDPASGLPIGAVTVSLNMNKL